MSDEDQAKRRIIDRKISSEGERKKQKSSRIRARIRARKKEITKRKGGKDQDKRKEKVI